jgi:hypothetical protein
MQARITVVATLCACSLGAQQQGPAPRNLDQMTVSMAEVRIGADEQGRSELCGKLRAMRDEGFPVVLAAKDEALTVQCQGRPAKALVLRLAREVGDPKRAVCEYAAAPAGLAYDRIDWIMLRRGGLPMTGEEIRNRLEPLSVRTFGALLYAFGFETIQGRDADEKALVAAPLHQIDGFCAQSETPP